MRTTFIEEPQLEFGGSGRHVDIRFGLMDFGPLDVGASRAAPRIRVGVVGSADSIEGVATWIDRCTREIPGKPGRYPNLFPRFPGFSDDGQFGTRLQIDTRLTRQLPAKVLTELAGLGRVEAVDRASTAFLEECRHLVESAGPDVIVIAPPRALLDAMDAPAERAELPDEEAPYFHDVIKARALPLAVPIQMVRPETYDERQRPRQRGRSWMYQGTQDEATRAWNFHTAVYYKAGGIPWRLPRDSTQLTTCYVGVSFYRSTAGDRLQTSMAEVFNERGEGMVLRGGPAQIDKDDRTPHLSGLDAKSLLSSALAAYRNEHGTAPARVVVHKSSHHLPDEIEGFVAAADEHRIEARDLLSVGRTRLRAFRSGYFPPLRGSLIELDQTTSVLFTKGSVDFFGVYPGMYVPSPIALRTESIEQTPRFLAGEVLALTKMNWNNSQFDGELPITLRAERQVGDILRHVGTDATMQARYAFYM